MEWLYDDSLRGLSIKPKITNNIEVILNFNKEKE